MAFKCSFVPARVTFMQGQSFGLFSCIVYSGNLVKQEDKNWIRMHYNKHKNVFAGIES